MKILIVKLSSLGDVVHTMPAVQDIRACWPAHADRTGADAALSIDWVVERGFAPLLRHCAGVDRVIACDLRQWRRSFWREQTRREWRDFLVELREREYDAVIDLQGLIKSVLIARLAHRSPGGKRYGLGNRTEGSSFEAPARWLVDVAIHVQPHIHALVRGRELCARALGYSLPDTMSFGLQANREPRAAGADAAAPAGEAGTGQASHRPVVLLVHGSSRADKLWPEENWIEAGQRIIEEGNQVALVHGSQEEESRSQRIARALGKQARVWPRMGLDELLDRMAQLRGVIGVDSGLSHVAVALDLPHVQIYNFDTAWRTGPIGAVHQQSIFETPTPSLEAVWSAWQQVLRA